MAEETPEDNLAIKSLSDIIDETKVVALYNELDIALNKVITKHQLTPYEVEIAMKFVDLKLKDLEYRSLLETGQDLLNQEKQAKGEYKKPEGEMYK